MPVVSLTGNPPQLTAPAAPVLLVSIDMSGIIARADGGYCRLQQQSIIISLVGGIENPAKRLGLVSGRVRCSARLGTTPKSDRDSKDIRTRSEMPGATTKERETDGDRLQDARPVASRGRA